MAQVQPQEQSLYGLPVPVTKAQTPPVIAKRDPVQSDTGYPLAQIWVNKVSMTAWILVNVQGGIATWLALSGASAGVQTINGFLPVANNFNYTNLGGLSIAGAAGVFSAGVNVDGSRVQVVGNQVTAQSASASPISSAVLSGVAHFDSTQFAVDANGFVQFIGASGAMNWNDIIGPIAAVINNGYFMASASVVTLPVGNLGDTIEVVDIIGGGVVIQASGGDLIRIGNNVSSAGGTATSSQAGDAVRLIFSAAAGAWISVPSTSGIWLLA